MSPAPVEGRRRGTHGNQRLPRTSTVANAPTRRHVPDVGPRISAAATILEHVAELQLGDCQAHTFALALLKTAAIHAGHLEEAA